MWHKHRNDAPNVCFFCYQSVSKEIESDKNPTGAISNEWKGAIKANDILKTTASVWSKAGYDFKPQDICL